MNWNHTMVNYLINLGFFGTGFAIGMIYGIKQLPANTAYHSGDQTFRF